MNAKSTQSPRLLVTPVFFGVLAFALFNSPAITIAQDGARSSLQAADEAIPGYVMLGEAVAGPHTVQVQVSPANPIVGISRFAVRVRDSRTGVDVEGAFIRLFGTPAEQGEKQYSPALNSPVDRVFYLAQLELEHAGVWAIDVDVDSELGTGVTVMSLQVGSRARSDAGGWGAVLFLVVTLAFVGGIAWIWYSSKKARKHQFG